MKVFIYKNGTGELHETVPNVIEISENEHSITLRTKPEGEHEAPNKIVFSKPEYFRKVLV